MVGEAGRDRKGNVKAVRTNCQPAEEGIKEPFMLRFALIAAAVSTMLSLNPALAKKVRHRPAQTTNQVAPTVNHAPPYDWQAGDCDVTNKTTLNTCSNGGR
jgi:hypothetical protein